MKKLLCSILVFVLMLSSVGATGVYANNAEITHKNSPQDKERIYRICDNIPKKYVDELYESGMALIWMQ